MLRKKNALFRRRKKTKKTNKSKTLQQKVRLFKSEFMEGFFVPFFPVFIRHLDIFALLGEWGAGEATEVSASCLFIQCI